MEKQKLIDEMESIEIQMREHLSEKYKLDNLIANLEKRRDEIKGELWRMKRGL